VNNVAIIEVASPAYSRITATWDSGPSPDHLKFACELCDTLGSHLQKTGCPCAPAHPFFKLCGGCFDSFMGKKRFRIRISTIRKAETTAEIAIWAEPHIRFLSTVYLPINELWKRWNGKIWEEFGQRLKNAVESRFQGCPVKWMTVAEWLAELPE